MIPGAGWRVVILLALWWPGCCLAGDLPWTNPQPFETPGFYVEFFPERLERRFSTSPPIADRDRIVREVLHTRLSLLSEETFDVMGLLSPSNGLPGSMSRGAKLGLLTGSAAYVGSTLLGDDSWLMGSAGLGIGFAVGALTDINWPPTFTLRWGEDDPLTFGIGWLAKPIYLPRHAPRFAGTCRPYSTAGIGLDYTPTAARDVNLSLFVDPFAAPGDTLGGGQFALSF